MPASTVTSSAATAPTAHSTIRFLGPDTDAVHDDLMRQAPDVFLDRTALQVGGTLPVLRGRKHAVLLDHFEICAPGITHHGQIYAELRASLGLCVM
jgi:hypothetical protein